MTRDDIIRMAREAGATPYTNRHYADRPTHTFNPEQLERFAALVAASERERCLSEVEQGIWFDKTTDQILDSIAAAIRAGGSPAKCQHCNGRGHIEQARRSREGDEDVTEAMCPRCHGDGTIAA